MYPRIAPFVAFLALLAPGCGPNGEPEGAPAPPAPERAPVPEEAFAAKREDMVRRTIEARGVRDEAVLKAMRKVRRHLFVPEKNRERSYADCPLPIGLEQTISQPYVVALMTEALRPKPGQKVLEVGTGSGYQAAVLAEIVGHVYSIEILEPLAETARKRLEELGYENVTVKAGDGYRGWPEHAPFDGILVTAAPDHVPQPLVDQLKVGGLLVIPVGEEGETQRLERIEKTADGVRRETIELVRFVPMTGEAQERDGGRGAK
jgi:protein-L-isoaspartate(D-aspartate) O-methyltransferase